MSVHAPLSRRTAGLAPALVVLLGVLLVAGPAQAATKRADAGPPDLKENVDYTFNAYFPRTITVHKGDSVRWRFFGFHTVTFLPKGRQRPPFLVQDAAHPYTGINDAAGSPFWFNGRPSFDFNPLAAFPAGGKAVTGKAFRNSGLPLEPGAPKPYTVKFTRTGTFKYICQIHRDMEGFVKVVSRRARIPTAAQDRRTVKREEAADTRKAARLRSFTPPAATIRGGHDSDPVEIYRFFPRNLTVNAGQPVTFTSTAPEPHTISFGPIPELKALANAQPTPMQFNGPNAPPTLWLDGRVILPSDPPPLPPYTGSNHGNGFFSTGALGQLVPGTSSTSFTFTTPGIYRYICLIHSFMSGTVTVR
jgi:plastocyanin